MEVSKLTISNNMTKPLNHFQRGELRWKKIKEMEDNGMLKRAKNRLDLVEMLGFKRGYNAGYTWVSNLISRGHLRETMYELGKDGKMEYEYSTVKAPMFSPKEWSSKPKKAETKKVVKDKTPVVTPISQPSVKIDNGTRVIIRYNDLTIELENIDQQTVEGIVEKLALVSKR